MLPPQGLLHTPLTPSGTMPHFSFPPRELLTGLGCLVQADEKMQSWEPPAFREAFGPDMWDVGMLGVGGLPNWVSRCPYSLRSTVRVWEPHPHPQQS